MNKKEGRELEVLPVFADKSGNQIHHGGNRGKYRTAPEFGHGWCTQSYKPRGKVKRRYFSYLHAEHIRNSNTCSLAFRSHFTPIFMSKKVRNNQTIYGIKFAQ